MMRKKIYFEIFRKIILLSILFHRQKIRETYKLLRMFRLTFGHNHVWKIQNLTLVHMNFLVKNNILVFLFLIKSLAGSAQQDAPFSLLFYNVENLFDTINSPQVRDGEFTPDGSKEWDSHRYYNKLNNLSKVIIAAGKWNPPDIIGIAEVENKTCFRDLVGKTVLSKMRYQIIYHESEDRRGIDVAL